MHVNSEKVNLVSVMGPLHIQLTSNRLEARMKFVPRLLFCICMAGFLSFGAFGANDAEKMPKAKLPAAKKSETAQDPATPEKTSPRSSSAAPASTAYYKDPELKPIPATTGALGLFTMETGDMLGKKGFSISAFANKFGRAPGSTTVLDLGMNVGYGATDWLTLFVGFDPYRHVRSTNRLELSSNLPGFLTPFPTPPGIAPIYRFQCPTCTLAYVEDYPFVSTRGGRAGEITLGYRIGLLSERRGNPFTLSAGNDFVFPTKKDIPQLQHWQNQLGNFNVNWVVAASKTVGNVVTLATNFAYRTTRDPRFSNGVHVIRLADQMRFSGGLLFFPEKRVQVMTEFNGLVFYGAHTPNNSFGPRDPVDNVSGVRLYPGRNVALDLGYRYMINLTDNFDRHGFVFKLGFTSWPPHTPPPPPVPPNRPPTVSCTADKSSVYADSGNMVVVRAQATDPDNDTLNYNWTTNGGSVEGTGPEVRWKSSGAQTGTYTVTANVDDGHGGTATCSTNIAVENRPNQAPTMTCSVERSPIQPGERTKITAVASDPDNDTLTYAWKASNGQVTGTGANVEFDSTGLSAGNYTITGHVDDSHGGTADCSASVDVQAPPPPPQASKVNQCDYRAAASARTDNECKRILDDVALRLKNEPKSTLVIVGYADPKEPRAAKLGQSRADNAKKFLGEKGIDASRIQTRTGAGQKGAGKENLRIDIILVPEGANY